MAENKSKFSFLNNIHLHLGAIGILTVVLWYASGHSITFSDLTNAIAGIPLLVVAFLWLFDVGVDTGKVYSKIANKYTGLVSSIFFMLFFGAFTGIIYALLITAGASASAVTILTAMVFAFIVVMPRTGTSVWILYVWLAATIVTGGSHFVLIPAAFSGVM
ncbi:MAG: hypothetical protein GXO35_03630 [Gammaproteobacteria bacterium]|nr:hypothetical protein [Gammaproteobacteria bacterium]